jgi:uncharacterized phage protein (TIGR02218 family)
MEVFILKVTNKVIMRYTSGPYDIDYDDGQGTQHYKAIPITRKEFTYDLAEDKYEITAPLTEQFFLDLGVRDLVMSIGVEIIETTNGLLLYRGSLQSTKHDYKKGVITLKCSQRFAQLDGEVPKKTYAERCSYNLGDRSCGVDMSTKGVVLPTFTVAGTYITSDKLKNVPDGYLLNGYVVADTGEHIWITGFNKTAGAISIITRFFEESHVGALTVYPGCDKQYSTCDNTFNNSLRFGGFPHIPSKNPSTQGFR